jgi:hypothetical protein
MSKPVPPNVAKVGWRFSEWMAATGIKSRQTLYNLEDADEIEIARTRGMAIILTAPGDYLARHVGHARRPDRTKRWKKIASESLGEQIASITPNERVQNLNQSTSVAPIKRPRGRPRKYPPAAEAAP